MLRSTFAVAAAGIGAGLVVALLLTRLLSGIVYGVAPHDPATFAGVSLGLLVVAVLAAGIPARRATRVDPATVLRHE